MYITASWGGVVEVEVEVGEACCSLAALKHAVCSVLPEEVDGEKVCLEVGGRPVDEGGAVGLVDGCRVDVVPTLAARSAATLREEGHDVTEDALCAAAQDGDMRLSRLYLDAGVLKTAADGRRPVALMLLHTAVEYLDTALCTLLLDRGVDVNVRMTGGTALHYAVRQGGHELCTFLLDRGADVHATDDCHRTPLDCAVGQQHAELCTLLLDRGSALSRARNTNGALHFAACQYNTKCCTLLLDRGADVNAKGAEGQTPLHLAVQQRNTEMCTLLLDRGSDAQAKNDCGRTPLHLAVCQQSIGLCTLLLARGDVNVKCEGNTPLHDAVSTQSTKVCALLLTRGADVHARGSEGFTPLHRAVLGKRIAEHDELLFDPDRHGSTDIFALLLDHGGDVSAKNDQGKTPLDFAVELECTELCALLRDRGDVHVPDSGGWTPLQYAVGDVYDNLRRCADANQ